MLSAKRQSQYKRYVRVRADHELDGTILPRVIHDVDGDGLTHRIDRIVDMREAPSLKAGGQGVRYICRVEEGTITLFHDDLYWFIEI